MRCVRSYRACARGFHTSRGHWAAAQLLQGDVDRFGGVSVALGGSADVGETADFRSRLRDSLATWRADGRCAVWVQVANEASAALPALLEEGFDWHHAKPANSNRSNGGYAMLVLWLPEQEASRLPLYPATQVGVGGLVLNSKGEVLLMQERVSHSAQVHGLWKLPGGLADTGEDLTSAAVREVREETGVLAKAEGVQCIHHRHGFRHGVSDLYFTVRMRAETTELSADPSEAIAVAWMPLEEARESPKVMDFNRRILALADRPLFAPHRGRHGSTMVKTEFYMYAAAIGLDPATGKPLE